MTAIDIATIIKELGMEIAAFTFMCWVVMYLVKNMVASVEKSTETLTLLNQSIREFMSKVKDEHADGISNQKELMAQHKEMIESLGRINGYKG